MVTAVEGRLVSASPLYPQAPGDLNSVRRRPDSNILNASDGENYGDEIFGRDLYWATTLLDDENTTQEAVRVLCSLQGTTYNPRTGEQPGAIHHEMLRLNSRFKQPAAIQSMVERLGHDGNRIISYESADVTLLVIKLISDYSQLDPSILNVRLTTKTGRPTTVAECTGKMLGWLEREVTLYGTGLPEFRGVEGGIQNQVRRDSATSLIHENGELANHHDAKTSIELGGYTYDALIKGAARLHHLYPNKAYDWHDLALEAQRATLSMWMEDKQFFAQGWDRDPINGNRRLIRTLGSNVALLLGTGIFDDLPPDYKSFFVSTIIEKVMSPDFLTEAGIRSTALQHAGLLPYFGYWNSHTAWPIDFIEIALGFMRQGLPQTAAELFRRLINWRMISENSHELIYVLPDGQVCFKLVRKEANTNPDYPTIIATNIPDRNQTWTTAAIYRAARDLAEAEASQVEPCSWQDLLQQRLRLTTDHTNLYSPKQASAIYAAAPTFAVDTRLAIKMEAEVLAKQSTKLY